MALRRAATSLAQRLAVNAPAAEVAASERLGTELFASSSGVRHASTLAVKQRMRAIKNIGKITKAMKMVAASKMRNAQVAVEGSRGIVNPFLRLFGDHPAVVADKNVTVAVTSDRGLCGGLNANISKYTRLLLKLYGQGQQQELVVIGDKGRAQLARTHGDQVVYTAADAYKQRVTFAQASMLAEEIAKHEPEAVRIVFNKFRSAISFKPTISTVLNAQGVEKQLQKESGNKLDTYEMEVVNEKEDVLRDLYEFQLAATLYNAMLENNCSEHASRMSAMENSTKSASEMLSKLTLSYNRDRQATITTELIEIIAGASALTDAD